MSILKSMSVACVLSFGLSACGGSSSSAPVVSTEDTISTDLGTSTDEDMSVEIIDEASVIRASDDIQSGGYVGSIGPLRSTITFPETIEGFKFGVVTRTGSNGVQANAVFGSFNTARRLFEYMSDFNRPLDSCQQVNLTAFNGFGEKFTPPFGGFTFASAGEVLPLFGPGGSAGELEEALFGYNLTRNIQALDDFELSINIPGNEFPAFETIVFPDAPPLLGFTTSVTPFIDVNDPFNPAMTPTLVWEASSDPETYLHLEFGADIPSANGGPPENTFSIHCSLQDDGEFTFPPQVLDLYTREPVNAVLRMHARLKVQEIRQTGGTLLVINIQNVP